MKILLIGASGLLGAAFAQSAYRRKHQVMGIVGANSAPSGCLSKTKQLDLRNLNALEAFVLEAFPDAIVNCAALSDPAACANDPELSRQLNVALPEKLALLARHLFATFIHISSEQVFDGKGPLPYTVDSPTSPPNEYAKHKREAELIVQELASEFASIIRLPLLNGNSPSGKRSIHERLFATWANGQAAKLFTDEVRQPCLVDNAADAMVELCERSDLKGILHWAGAEPLSRFEMGKLLVSHFGLPETLIEATERGDDPRFANRQADLSLDLQPLSAKLKTQPLPFVSQLDSLVVPKPFRSWYHSL